MPELILEDKEGKEVTLTVTDDTMALVIMLQQIMRKLLP